LTAAKIHEISQEGQQENGLWPQPTKVSAQRTMDDHQFRKLLDWFGYSWAGYRKVRKGVKKRIARHMQELQCPAMDAYLELLASDGDALEQCRLRMTVSISRFFRDRQLWQGLQDRILPELLGAPRDFLRVWSAGCACGEEPYRNNLLTYYQSRLVEHALAKIAAGLADDGWLIVGAHEKLPERPCGLIRDDAVPWAYRNQS
jgi:chemotaxis methyl-accepting protein methylase